MSDIEGKTAREAVSKCGQRANFNWARAAWLVTPIAWRRRKIFDYFGDDDVGGLALTARRLRADSGCQQYGGRHRDFEYV